MQHLNASDPLLSAEPQALVQASPRGGENVVSHDLAEEEEVQRMRAQNRVKRVVKLPNQGPHKRASRASHIKSPLRIRLNASAAM